MSGHGALECYGLTAVRFASLAAGLVNALAGGGTLITLVFKAGEQNWPFPNMSQAFIGSRIPNGLSGFELADKH